ncbi:MAG TPA: ribonuclease P protein component [Candidatus Saccharimonadales bacterium]|nr:ribonuclease P protein component [Candidatus Saccharimonadales bacterium]
MIHRTHRFHGRNSLRFVYKNGQTVRSACSALKFAANPRRRTYRVAVVVSRKVHKSAVVRNRIRRRIYEIIRAHAANIVGAYDMVFTAFSDQLATMEQQELSATIVTQLEEAGIIKNLDEPPAPSSENHAIVKH